MQLYCITARVRLGNAIKVTVNRIQLVKQQVSQLANAVNKLTEGVQKIRRFYNSFISIASKLYPLAAIFISCTVSHNCFKASFLSLILLLLRRVDCIF